MTFFLGTHEPSWLARLDVPLFISHRRLTRRKTFPRALAPWALDSGGFTEVTKFGHFETPSRFYARQAQRYQEEIGQLRWAAIQDWMCEPFALAKTGRTIAEHQSLTIDSCIALRAVARDVSWAPVLQGWRTDDYLSHAEQYAAAGIDLRAEPIVGVGSVCRRQATQEAVDIFSSLHRLGLKLHGFGLKIEGVAKCWPYLESSDSLAWSRGARNRKPLPGCTHKTCANCPRFAVLWRKKVLHSMSKACQLRLALSTEAPL